MVHNRDISSSQDNLVMAATADQIHVDHLMAKIHQLTEANNISGDKIKQLSETNAFLARQVQ